MASNALAVGACSDYQQMLLSAACVFGRTGILRALVAEFGADTKVRGSGLVLVDEAGMPHARSMTGFGLCVEFGCEGTFELIVKLLEYLGSAHTHQHSEYNSPAFRGLYRRNKPNRLSLGTAGRTFHWAPYSPIPGSCNPGGVL